MRWSLCRGRSSECECERVCGVVYLSVCGGVDGWIGRRGGKGGEEKKGKEKGGGG